MTPHINRIGTAVPPNDVHEAFIDFARSMLPDQRERVLFDRMATRSGIAHRWSVVQPGPLGRDAIDNEKSYRRGYFPTTAARMKQYETYALGLALSAVRKLGPLNRITHVIVASCTGFMAPGLDLLLIDALGLSPAVERTVIGFMGCSASVPAMKLASHAIRSNPDARVLIVALELCTLHLQETSDLETILSFLLFGDGCAAALITGEPEGLVLHDFRAAIIPNTQDLITWRIGDQGFDMRLSGRVPTCIGNALREDLERNNGTGILAGKGPEDYNLWAIHAGGRTILDAVEQSYHLSGNALRHSRTVLQNFGNMSSATLLFILARILAEEEAGQDGIGMAFGPGMSAETFRFSVC